MNSIICLALSCLLVGLLYVFMRQQFSAQDRKIHDLTQLVASVAAELQQGPEGFCPAVAPALPPAAHLEVKRLPERVTVSDDSESESDESEDNDESDSESVDEAPAVQKVTKLSPTAAPAHEVEHEEIHFEAKPSLVNTLEVVEDFSIILDLNEGTKTINLFESEATKTNYEKLTVKELKELVQKEAGPGSLKTKKELIEFLEKKK